MVIGYIFASVILVSLVSLVGLFFVSKQLQFKNRMLLFLVSLSAGTLFGGAFLHLLPEAVEKQGFTLQISFLLLSGVVIFFVLEKFIQWRHCHGHGKHNPHHVSQNPKKHIAILNLFGDGLHNFLDGLVIAGSYLVSIPTGIATTIAVVIHEIPQEIADFGVLLYSGFSRGKALLLNFLSAIVAVLGAIVGIMISSRSQMFIQWILPFAAGGFVYIAGSNLIPELHKECDAKDTFWHLFAIILGIGLMVMLKRIGN